MDLDLGDTPLTALLPGGPPRKGAVDYLTFQKMAFISNAIERGWTVQKNADKYLFTKKHNGSQEVYLDSYLRQFLEANLDFRQVDFLGE